MRKDELVIFSTAKVVMDTYKKRYDDAKKNKKQRLDNLNRNYKPGSPLFVQERDSIEPEYRAEIESAREDCRREFTEALENTIAKERAAATVTGGSVSNTLETLKNLDTMPVSVDEYTALVDTLGGKLYWVDRYFEKIAEKNGIQNTGVQPSLTVKLQVLNRLSADVDEFLNSYNAEDKNFIVTSSDSHIFKMEEQYTNGYAKVSMSDKETAKRLVSKALNRGDSIDRACYLANTIKTSAPEMQRAILTELSERDSTFLSDPAMSLVGVSAIIDDFKKADYKDMKKAEQAIEQIRGAQLKNDRETIAFQNLENPHFMDAVRKSNDKDLKALVQEMQEVKKAGEEKEQREAVSEQ